MGLTLEPGKGLSTGKRERGGRINPDVLAECEPLIDAPIGAQVAPLLFFDKQGTAGSAGYAYKVAVQDLAESRGTPARIVSLARQASDLQALFVPPTTVEDENGEQRKTTAAERKQWTEDNVPEALRQASPDSWTFVLARAEVTS